MTDTEKIFEMLGRLDERTELILEQTKKTNGRVTILEDRIDRLEAKNDASSGAKSAWLTIRKGGFEIGKLTIAALLGAYFGGKK